VITIGAIKKGNNPGPPPEQPSRRPWVTAGGHENCDPASKSPPWGDWGLLFLGSNMKNPDEVAVFWDYSVL
jgi:hypothetical protein